MNKMTKVMVNWASSQLRFRSASLILSAIFLTGCAGVTVTPLNPDDNTRVSGGEDGLRYYMPMPYLLVMELPPTVSTTNLISSSGFPTPESPSDFDIPTNGATDYAKTAPSGGTGTGTVSKQTQTSSSTKPSQGIGQSQTQGTNITGNVNSTQTSPTAISDVSFGASTPQYIVKLIYLPDMRRPMAMTSSSGLWGTSEMNPTLQDGWMLTSLNANSDSKTAETLQSASSIVGSLIQGAAKTAGSAVAGGPGSGAPQSPPDLSSYYTTTNAILHPGLYSFDYDSNGVLINLKAVSFFTGTGAVRPDSNGVFPTQSK